MKKITGLTLLALISMTANAQSWQWGKRGGSTDALEILGTDRPEEVYSMATDSQGNVYVLSSVGLHGLDVDGNDKTNFGDLNPIRDVVLASFSCNGSYRWSKIIGGKGRDIVSTVQVDSQDNIYIAGKFGDCGDAVYPPRIDNDVVLSQATTDCSVLFIAKYNSSGVLLWFKRPQPPGVDFNTGVGITMSYGLATDASGNSYWHVQIPPGTYGNGAYTNTSALPSHHILKYDLNGNFSGGTPIDMQLGVGFNNTLQFARNPYNGFYYMTSHKTDDSQTAIVGGTNITHTVFLACFNASGQFLWLKEDTATSWGNLFFYNLAFDPDNNIYVAGRLAGLNSNSFAGVSAAEPVVTSVLIKLNPTAQNALWSTYYPHNGALQRGAIIVNGNEVGFAGYCYGTNFSWGTQSINATPTNGGQDALLARFNRQNGACLGLHRIPGNVGFNDWGTALATDPAGDYLMGGNCGRDMTFANNSISTVGSQGDFYVAKFSATACGLGSDEFMDEGLLLHPNPAQDFVNLNTKEAGNYVIYSLTGSIVAQGKLAQGDNEIYTGKLSTGSYVITITGLNGGVRRAQLIKK